MSDSIDSSAPDCVACGACCFSRDPRYLQVTGNDYTRLAEDAEELTQWIGNKVYMRLTGSGLESHCAALNVSEAGYYCRVYERRPNTCRELERGSPECAAERHEKAERPLLSLRRQKAPQNPSET